MSPGKMAKRMTTCQKVVYDKNYIESILEEIGDRKVFILASKSLDKNSDIVSSLVEKLEQTDKFGGLFMEIEQHTTDRSCIRAANLIKESKCKCVVTLGGGSITDAAKAIRLCITYNIQDSSGFQRFHRDSNLFSLVSADFDSDLLVINVPTTLSAGEFSLIAGVKDTQKGLKFGYLHDKLVADVVILDPSVTLYTPEYLWISSGVRAIDHSIETICSPMSNILADTVCKKSLKLLLENLKKSTATDSSGIEARRNCLLGAWLSITGLTQSVPLGGSHGIGHILGAYGIIHGHTSCIMAPHIIKYNWDAMTPSMKADLGDVFSGEQLPYNALFEFIKDLKMPQTLEEVSIKKEDIASMAQQATHDDFTQANLRPLTAAKIEEILSNIYSNAESAL